MKAERSLRVRTAAGNVGGAGQYGSMGEESRLTGAEALDGFSPATRAWFEGAFAEPTPQPASRTAAMAAAASGARWDRLMLLPPRPQCRSECSRDYCLVPRCRQASAEVAAGNVPAGRTVVEPRGWHGQHVGMAAQESGP